MTTPPINRPDVLAALDAALKAWAGGATRDKGTLAQDHNLYEAYLFGLVIKAAVRCGYSTSLETAGGAPAPSLRLRGAPGRLVTQKSNTYTHAVLRPPSSSTAQPLQLHTGLEIDGRSGTTHEADILVITQKTATDCLINRRQPKGNELLLHIEAKCYTEPVKINLGREFIGIACDLGAVKSALVAPLMSDKAHNLAEHAPLTPATRGHRHVRPRHPGEVELVQDIQRLLRAYRKGTLP